MIKNNRADSVTMAPRLRASPRHGGADYQARNSVNDRDYESGN
jgi:hypothetical protein